MRRFILAVTGMLVLISFPAHAADVKLAWDPSDNASGYRIYMSTDQGKTWDMGTDAGDVVQYNYPNVPDTGLILFRVSAYNSSNEVIRYEAGVWYCADWVPPTQPSGIGIE